MNISLAVKQSLGFAGVKINILEESDSCIEFTHGDNLRTVVNKIMDKCVIETSRKLNLNRKDRLELIDSLMLRSGLNRLHTSFGIDDRVEGDAKAYYLIVNTVVDEKDVFKESLAHVDIASRYFKDVYSIYKNKSEVHTTYFMRLLQDRHELRKCDLARDCEKDCFTLESMMGDAMTGEKNLNIDFYDSGEIVAELSFDIIEKSRNRIFLDFVLDIASKSNYSCSLDNNKVRVYFKSEITDLNVVGLKLANFVAYVEDGIIGVRAGERCL